MRLERSGKKVMRQQWPFLCWLGLLTLLSLCSGVAFANNTPIPSNMASVGELSTNLMGPVGMMAHIGYTICYILGAGLLVTAGLRYAQYRKNSNQVRLGEVFAALTFALVLIILPLIFQLSQGAGLLPEGAQRPTNPLTLPNQSSQPSQVPAPQTQRPVTQPQRSLAPGAGDNEFDESAY